MEKLFIYYSYTGNGEIVANNLKDKGFDLRKVTPKKSLPKSFFWGVLTGGFLAGTKHKSKLVDFDSDVSKYDLVVIGSPIWNGRFCSPINTVLSKVDFASKELFFVFYSGSGEAAKAIKRINKEFPNAKYIILKEPKKYPDELKKLEFWYV